MQTIEYHGWQDCVRLANDVIEIIASTSFGPRIMRAGFIGRENMLHELEEWQGKIGPADEWVNYGGHRVWHAPEAFPRTYAPDSSPLKQFVSDGNSLILVQETEPESGIGKQLQIQLGPGSMPFVKVDHILTNHNEWSIELAPWALSVVAAGGRVILPQEPYAGHGQDHNYAPSRPLILWPFTDMSDSRWTWGKNYIQLKSDTSKDFAQKVGIYGSEGWGLFAAADGDLMIKFIDVDDLGPDSYPDFGSNFETFTKGDFEELETLGPLQVIEPGKRCVHTEYWVLEKEANLPHNDIELAAVLPQIIENAKQIASKAHGINKA